MSESVSPKIDNEDRNNEVARLNEALAIVDALPSRLVTLVKNISRYGDVTGIEGLDRERLLLDQHAIGGTAHILKTIPAIAVAKLSAEDVNAEDIDYHSGSLGINWEFRNEDNLVEFFNVWLSLENLVLLEKIFKDYNEFWAL